MASFRKAYALKQRLAAGLLKRRGIHGVGIGLRDPVRPRKGAAIIVYAQAMSSTSRSRRKKGTKTVSPPPIPRKLCAKYGVPIRVVKSSKFLKCGPTNTGGASKFRNRIRPVIAGYSVGTPSSSGTAGLIVSHPKLPGSRYILSNNHVLVNNNERGVSKTLQPGGADGGVPEQDTIGQLNAFIKLKKKGSNYLDAALSRPLNRHLLKPKYAVYGTVPGHIKTYKIGDQFKKVGRTTGTVTGTVESIHTDILVDYGDYGNLGSIKFKNQSVIRGKRPVSLPGDSGSVWLTRCGNLAAAVNFAGSDEGKLSISYPVHWFMQVFGTRVAGPSRRRLLGPNRRRTQNYLYTRPLSAQLLKSITLTKVNRLNRHIGGKRC